MFDQIRAITNFSIKRFFFSVPFRAGKRNIFRKDIRNANANEDTESESTSRKARERRAQIDRSISIDVPFVINVPVNYSQQL